MMPTALIIGATRGLGAALATKYSSQKWTVLGTARSKETPKDSKVDHWITGVDLMHENCGEKLASGVKSHGPIDVTVISAGFFGLESFDDLKWQDEVKMYTTSAIAPPFLVHALYKAGALKENGGKIILIGSESGVWSLPSCFDVEWLETDYIQSVTLRHEKEGGGNYGHHASKAAANMVGKLLSLDLKDKGIAVGVVHVSISMSYIETVEMLIFTNSLGLW